MDDNLDTQVTQAVVVPSAGIDPNRILTHVSFFDTEGNPVDVGGGSEPEVVWVEPWNSESEVLSNWTIGELMPVDLVVVNNHFCSGLISRIIGPSGKLTMTVTPNVADFTQLIYILFPNVPDSLMNPSVSITVDSGNTSWSCGAHEFTPSNPNDPTDIVVMWNGNVIQVTVGDDPVSFMVAAREPINYIEFFTQGPTVTDDSMMYIGEIVVTDAQLEVPKVNRVGDIMTGPLVVNYEAPGGYIAIDGQSVKIQSSQEEETTAKLITESASTSYLALYNPSMHVDLTATDSTGNFTMRNPNNAATMSLMFSAFDQYIEMYTASKGACLRLEGNSFRIMKGSSDSESPAYFRSKFNPILADDLVRKGWIETGGGRNLVVAKGNVTGAVSCDLSAGSHFTMTLTGNTTLSFTNVPAAGTEALINLTVTQNATGNFTLTFPGGTTKIGTLGLAANAVTLVRLITTTAGSPWRAVLETGFA